MPLNPSRRERNYGHQLASATPRLGRPAVLESVEPRRLFASVAPGWATDLSYGGVVSNGTAMDFSPDGRLWVTTQTGSVFVIQPDGSAATLAASLTVDSFFERGLLGIAFDPAFGQSNNYVYLYRTIPSAQGGPYNRLARFEVSGNTINLATEAVILNLNALSAGNHNGGAIHFGPDGKIYVGVGENASSSNAQNLGNLLGKLLRVNPDPLDPIPSDNPTTFPGITGSTSGINRAIYAVGLRNPYTFAIQPGTGRIHINDVGAGAWEEVNVGQPGLNYGWPQTEGNAPPGVANVTYPLYTYANDATTSAITGGTFYNPPFNQFTPDMVGDYFFADYSGNWIRRLDADNAYALQTTGGVSNGLNFLQGGSGIVDLKVGSDGALYFLQRSSGNGGQGVRVIRSINPKVMSSEFKWTGNILPAPPHRLEYKFTRNVSASLGASDLLLEDLTNGGAVPTANIAVSFNATTNTATFTFPGFTNGILPDADYRATLLAAGVTDPEGDPLAANEVDDFFVLTGDANHDHVIDFDDYVLIDLGYNLGYGGWENGDFDYNGEVDFDDYVLIDFAYNNQ